MPVKIEAFLALEESLATRMTTTLTAITRKLYGDVERAIQAKEWPLADTLVRGLDLTPVFDQNKAYIDYVSQLSILFGASRVTRSPKDSAVGLGFEKETVAQTIQSFKWGLLLNTQEALINAGLQLIAMRKRADDPVKESYLGTVLKADKPSAILPFGSFMDKNGKAYMNITSSLHTSRLSAFGYTSEAEVLGVTVYQINEQLDNRICPVCAVMHGKQFNVRDARNFLDIVVRTQDPDTLKNLQPWPSQSKAAVEELKGLTMQELVSNGWHVPPFHPRCRGLLSQSRNAPRGAPDLTRVIRDSEPYMATGEDFNQLGVKLSPAKVSLWNELMKTAPAEVIAKLSGKSVTELLSMLETSEADPKELLGIKTLSVNQTGVNIELWGLVHGSKHLVLQDYYFRKVRKLFVGLVDIAKEDESVLRDVLRGLYGTAKDTAMDSIEMVADTDLSGFAMAKYGFVPTVTQWANIKSQIHEVLKKTTYLAGVSELELNTLNYIIASSDPMDIFALADLPSLGSALLAGTNWIGELDLNDAESLGRFISILGAKS